MHSSFWHVALGDSLTASRSQTTAAPKAAPDAIVKPSPTREGLVSSSTHGIMDMIKEGFFRIWNFRHLPLSGLVNS
jgi:hypothetical protein